MTASAMYLSSFFVENVVELSVYRTAELSLYLEGFACKVEIQLPYWIRYIWAQASRSCYEAKDWQTGHVL